MSLIIDQILLIFILIAKYISINYSHGLSLILKKMEILKYCYKCDSFKNHLLIHLLYSNDLTGDYGASLSRIEFIFC